MIKMKPGVPGLHGLRKSRSEFDCLKIQEQERTADLSGFTAIFSWFDILGSQVRVSLIILILMVLLQVMLYRIDVLFRPSFNILAIV